MVGYFYVIIGVTQLSKTLFSSLFQVGYFFLSTFYRNRHKYSIKNIPKGEIDMITVLVCGAVTTFIVSKIAEDKGHPMLGKVIPTFVGYGFVIGFFYWCSILFF